MATVTLKGNPIQIHGALPAVGSDAPGFRLVGGNLKDITLHDFAGKRKILNIFPSVDTPTCATSVRKFNEKAAALDNTVVLCISARPGHNAGPTAEMVSEVADEPNYDAALAVLS